MARSYQLSASLICGSPITIGEDLKSFEKGDIERIHFDVMDGIFVPRFGLYPELLRSVKEVSTLPVEVHLMIERPEYLAATFINAGADVVVVHAESTKHLNLVLQTINTLGCRAGVALNPATPLSVLDYVLEDIDFVVLMAINPGIVGHGLIPSMIKKISDLREKLVDHPNIKIEIDGGVSFESAAEMVRSGADILVCGTSTIFKKGEDLENKVCELRKHINSELAEDL